MTKKHKEVLKDNANFYETFDWSTLQFSAVKNKIDKIIEIIPRKTKTIIDIGCGNGIITNELAKHFEVTGVDRSKAALDFVKTKKILASCEKIPIDEKFDIVFSSELLEHLEDPIFFKTIEEFKRLSNDYILISVPNNESLKKSLIKCPQCDFIYNKSYHFRSFDLQKIRDLFNEYTILEYYELGAKTRGYNKLLGEIKHKFTNPNSWIPYYWLTKPTKSMCPNCENSFFIPTKFSFLGYILNVLNMFLSPSKPYWLLVLLKKTTA